MKLWRYGLALERLGDRYRLDGVLGSGGMADVCLAWDEREQHEVAIKVIKSSELDQRSLNRFLKEASQVARWRHPHILRIYGDARLELVDSEQGSIVPYIVMEYARNGDLQHRLTSGKPYPFAETLAIFEQLCLAVAFAHEQGVIHRDLKPHNVLFRLLPDGLEQAVLSDFGLAVEMSATHFTFASGGTLPYMAPEQLQGQAEAASDIFALGVILYQLCTGHLPFQRTIQDLRRRGPLPAPRLPSTLYRLLPPDLDAVILTALAERPEQRYSDALTFWDAVQDVVTAETVEAISQYELRTSQPAYPRRQRAPLQRSSNSFPPGRAASDPQPLGLPGQHMLDVSDSGHTPLRQPGVTAPMTRRARNTLPAHLDSQRQQSTSLPAQSVPASSLRAHSSAVPASSTRGRLVPPLASSADPAASRARGAGAPVTRTSSGPGRRDRRPLLVIALAILVVGGAFFATLNATSLRAWLGGVIAQATVTTRSEQGDYTFTLLNDAPSNAAQNQIAAHTVSAQSQSQPQAIQGTGQNRTHGIVAHGTLTFLNGSFNPFSATTALTVPGPNGLQILTDGPFTISAANPDTKNDGQVQVPAHITTVGKQGNISAMSVNETCCTDGNFIAVKNTTPFTGGQDPKDYMFIQASDVAAVLDAQKGGTEQQARGMLSGSVAQGEQLLADSVQCVSQAHADQPVGDKGENIPAARVTVTSRCHGTSYDQGAVRQVVLSRLGTQAARDIGSGYTPMGDTLKMQITSESAANMGNTVTLHVHATENFSHQAAVIQATHKSVLIRLYAGQRQRIAAIIHARPILVSQIGIQNVFISIVDRLKQINVV